MRLSTEARRDEALALRVIHAALDAGATWLDTADAYALDDSDIGHNERLIARALATYGGDRPRITVITKGGLTRPGGRWVTDGRARHLRRACEASVTALGVESIDLYLLHAPDHEVPLATSVRALVALKDAGLVRAIGLSNVSVPQLEEARALAEISAVEVALSVFAEETFQSGVPEYCLRHGLRLIAHSPLGGPKKKSTLAKHRTLRRIADKHGTTPALAALAWLSDLAPELVVIPGATTVENASRLAQLATLSFDDEDRALLDAAFPHGQLLRTPRARRRPVDAEREVVVLMGIQGAGKSSLVLDYVERGYVRLNRDELGGKMSGLHEKLDLLLAGGTARVVLDNTYPTRAVRNEVIETAWRRRAHARCVWLATSLEDAQVNAVERMLDRTGELLGPEAIKREAKKDPNLFAPDVQFRYQRMFEAPSLDEGFESVETVAFQRRPWPGTGRALFVELDGLVRRSRSGARAPLSPDDVELAPGAADALRRHASEGSRLIGLAWIPEVAGGVTTAERAQEVFARTEALLGVSIHFYFCPHAAGPVACWCRRPLPGLGVSAVRTYALDPAACVMAGSSAADRLFAERLGFRHQPGL